MTAGEAWLQKTAPRAAAERPSKTGRLGDHARDAPYGAAVQRAATGGPGKPAVPPPAMRGARNAMNKPNAAGRRRRISLALPEPPHTPETEKRRPHSLKYPRRKYTAAALLASGASAFTTSGNALPAATRPQAAAQAPTMAVAGGINGFGRIGRLVARIMAKSDAIDLKLVNSGAANEYMAYQFKYDSIHGRYPGTIEPTADGLLIDGVLTPTTHTRDPSEIPFGAMGAEYICESTGAFLTADKVAPHIAAGAKKIIFSAPAKDDSPTVVMGVNEETYDPSMVAVSCASCTTNGLAPMVKAINDKFGIEEGLMTTVHAMTATQKVVDASSNKDWRGGRCASGNIIPSSTGAAKAVAKVIPDVKGKLTGMAFRVPTADVSVVDLTVKLNTATSYDDICAEVSRLADGPMTGILGYCDEPLVSTDFETEPTSSVFDAGAGIMLSPKFVKCVAWYDNEWGYSNRVVDLMCHMAAVDAKVAV